jgi:hypothetical protein
MNMLNLKDVYIIDDLLLPAHVDYLADFYTGPNVDWKFQEDITYTHDNADFNIINDKNYGFSNLIHSTADQHSSPLYHTVAPILFNVLNRFNITDHYVMKMRAFLQMPSVGQTNKINNPHVDADIEHIVILYYLTDADGDTIIYNETKKSNQYTIMDRVQPKKGRCVVFNGKHFHSSSQPTTGIRATIILI